MTAPHIEFQNVSTRYGSKEVLHGVSFAIQRNEIFGIIGPANSGKTTMLKAINRTLDASNRCPAPGSVTRVSVRVSDGQPAARRPRRAVASCRGVTQPPNPIPGVHPAPRWCSP